MGGVTDANSAVPAVGDEAWHTLDAGRTLEELGTSADGLTDQDAIERLERFGRNRLPEPARRKAIARLASQFHNLLIYVLLAAAVLSLALGHDVDAIVIVGVVLVNAIVGFIQEGRAEHALEAIRRMLDTRTTVIRGGHRRMIPAEEIVPGDVVLLQSGDRVPADLRLLRASSLRVEEAILTGESMAVEKTTEAVSRDAALGDRSAMAYSGTLVAAGQGQGVAVATGERTELGRISLLMGAVEKLKTPLIQQIDAFAKRLTLIILAVCAIAFFFGFFVRDYPVDDAFMVVIGLAVSAIPEGLPAVMTIALAIGVQRMAARNAIIRRLPAVETLGSVSVICTDKTGTLTRNEMTVQSLMTDESEYAVSGVGYVPTGEFSFEGRVVDPVGTTPLLEMIRAGVLCNDAVLHRSNGGWQIDGDPMEGALVTLAHKAGLDASQERQRLPRRDVIPFDATHRFMATLHSSHENGRRVVVKGAPERILDMCCDVRTSDGTRPLQREVWHEKADRLAGRGQRVLAFATRAARNDETELTFDSIGDGLTLLGLAGFIDPPREEAIDAVSDCRAAGIRVLMVTGDHAVTAAEVARQLALDEDPKVVTGRDIDAMSDADLKAAVRQATVFARTTPEHKLRLVNALQEQGLVVAMTGDGVNDAPALKRAAVGVAMGGSGTEAAKESAEMVLIDDNFASIVAAVREGRTVYDNLMKLIAWTLPTNGGEGATILGAMVLGLALPITPIQILWINLVTVVALGLTLAFEPTEPGTMRRSPRPAGQPILNGELIWKVVFVSALFVAGAFGMFFWANSRGLSLEEARTIVVNTLVVMEIFYLFSVRFVYGSSLTWQGVAGTRAVVAGIGGVVVAQLLFTYLPFMQGIFETRSLSLLDGVAIVGVGVVLLAITETEKRLRRWSGLS